MKSSKLSHCLAALFLLLAGFLDASEAKYYGITRQVHGSSVFTFRNERLVHELTRLGEHWTEVFYNGSERILVRTGEIEHGVTIVTSVHFTGRSSESVNLVSRKGAIHPQRISVGGENYNRTAEGFFEVVENPSQVARESSLMGVEYGTKELFELRKKLLKKAD